MARVWVVAGAGVGRSFEPFDGARVGRGEDSDLVLPEASVSRRHAVFERDGERWVLVDAGSRNGIRVAEQRVERRVLEDGDLLTLGKVVLRFRLADAPSSPAEGARSARGDPNGERGERRPRARTDDAATLPVVTRAERAELDRRARAPAPASADSRPKRRGEVLAELEGEGGFFSGDLAQRPGWMRWSLYLLALAVAVAAFVGAFRLVQFLREA